MASGRKVYPPEFKRRMVELVRAGRSPEELGKEFEPSPNTIRKWAIQADLNEGNRADGLLTAERKELRELRHKVKQMELEREILGKAAARPTRALPGRVPRPGSRLHFRSVRIRESGAPLRSSGPAVYRVATMCRVLEVSRSGYYAWLKREPSARDQANAALLKVIKDIHQESDETYGAPRIHAELEDRGPQASLNRVARVMREAEIQGVSPRKWTHTTLRANRARPAPDLVDRDFTATGPDELWVADITYIPTWAGFLFLAIVLDVWSRRVVGWAMATHMRTE